MVGIDPALCEDTTFDEQDGNTKVIEPQQLGVGIDIPLCDAYPSGLQLRESLVAEMTALAADELDEHLTNEATPRVLAGWHLQLLAGGDGGARQVVGLLDLEHTSSDVTPGIPSLCNGPECLPGLHGDGLVTADHSPLCDSCEAQ